MIKYSNRILNSHVHSVHSFKILKQSSHRANSLNSTKYKSPQIEGSAIFMSPSRHAVILPSQVLQFFNRTVSDECSIGVNDCSIGLY